MTTKGNLAALSLVSCALFLFVGCGTDPRPEVLGPGLVTPGASPSESAMPTEDPSPSDSSSPTPSDESPSRTPSPTPVPTPSPTPNTDAVCGGGSTGPNSGLRVRPFRDEDAELDAEDQRGNGRSVDIEDVQISRKNGFVAVCWPDARRLLGSARVARSEDDSDLQIDLDERITKTIRIVVVLYADDGDGRLDGATDQIVTDDDYDEVDDYEADELTYRYTG